MNKQYLKEIFENNKEEFINGEQELSSIEELKDYIRETISSNILYDFNIDIDLNKLFEIDKSIDIEINNGRILRINQTSSDKAREGIGVEHINSKGKVDRRDLISEGDFVMLLNYYYHIKDNDIKDGFINRDGLNDRKDFFNSESDSDYYL